LQPGQIELGQFPLQQLVSLLPLVALNKKVVVLVFKTLLGTLVKSIVLTNPACLFPVLHASVWFTND
jgi:hypothetical protein